MATTLAGSATYGSNDGVGTIAKFYFPTGVTINTVTNVLYVADKSNNNIRAIDTLTGNFNKLYYF